MDLDTTVRDLDMTAKNIESIVTEIFAIDVDDGINFQLEKIERIRENNDYNNFRVHFIASYGKIRNKIKIGITTGDEIPPAAIEYSFHTLFDENDIAVYAYTLETILVEKYETIIRREIENTRSRDFYDLYVLFHLYRKQINPTYFKIAVEHTARKRNSLPMLEKYSSICEDIRIEQALINNWINYVRDEAYATYLSFNTHSYQEAFS